MMGAEIIVPTVATADPKLENLVSRLKDKNCEKNKVLVNGYMDYWENDITKASSAESEECVNKRQGEATTLTNAYYDMVTDFYEYGWGESFHFARMFRNTSFATCIARHEDFLALRLGLTTGMQVLDVGCGVGGPMREIARFSGANVTGINNNDYQVSRCNILAEKQGLSNYCRAIKGNFMDMPFEADTYDAAYSIEATCHASSPEAVYCEIFRVLKPGGTYACYEWCTTDLYDETDMDQKAIVHAIEEGDALPKLATTRQALDALRNVGFEIVESMDLADPSSPLSEAQVPWYEPLQGSYSLNNIRNWRMTPPGRWVTDKFVTALEYSGLAPPGTKNVTALLNKAADALVDGGARRIFTPMFFFVVRKPLL